MAVSAQSVKDRAETAAGRSVGNIGWSTRPRPAAPSGGGSWSDRASTNLGFIDLREGGRVTGGGLVYEGERLTTGWHWHDLHQIEYALQGAVEVDTAAGTYLLPPHQAAWIPAGCVHQATLHASVTTFSVLFEPSLVAVPDDRVRIVAASPLIREMVLHAARWPITRADDDPVADHFFRTLGHLVGEALEHEAPLSLPTSDDPIVAAAIAHTQTHLATTSVDDVCASIGVSERTLRRHFTAALGMPWRSYLLQARLLRSMALLAEPDRTVLDVAIAVGFEDVSAFTRAFRRHAGEAPSIYRRRVAERS